MIRAAAIMITLAGTAHAQDLADDAMMQIADADAQLQRARTDAEMLTALATAITAYDGGLVMLRQAARDLAEDMSGHADELAVQEAQIGQLLGVLAAVDRSPQVVRHAHPDGPAATYRAGLLVAGMAPALETEASQLAALLERRRGLMSRQQDVAQAIEHARADAEAMRERLEQAMGDGGGLPRVFDEDPVTATLLASGAESLGSFLAELGAAVPDPDGALTPTGNLDLPVAGLILPDDGSGRPGVRIAAAPRALVTTPVTATVLFQGPLLNYGHVVILEPAPDVMFVLAGLEEVFAQAGRVLPAGAPIGLMPDAQGYDDGILTQNLALETGQPAQSLYLEVREGQTATQTDAWFALE